MVASLPTCLLYACSNLPALKRSWHPGCSAYYGAAEFREQYFLTNGTGNQENTTVFGRDRAISGDALRGRGGEKSARP
jgi:hypothetical protein